MAKKYRTNKQTRSSLPFSLVSLSQREKGCRTGPLSFFLSLSLSFTHTPTRSLSVTHTPSRRGKQVVEFFLSLSFTHTPTHTHPLPLAEGKRLLNAACSTGLAGKCREHSPIYLCIPVPTSPAASPSGPPLYNGSTHRSAGLWGTCTWGLCIRDMYVYMGGVHVHGITYTYRVS
jgi:hypothetical protein